MNLKFIRDTKRGTLFCTIHIVVLDVELFTTCNRPTVCAVSIQVVQKRVEVFVNIVVLDDICSPFLHYCSIHIG